MVKVGIGSESFIAINDFGGRLALGGLFCYNRDIDNSASLRSSQRWPE